jgi:hypothetical protein
MPAYMKTLNQCLEDLVAKGYTDDFKVENEKLTSQKTEKTFEAEQVRIADFFRFEGPSNPDDNTILYAIETSDGLKGTLVEAYGAYSDEAGRFILNVENIQKKAAVKEK